MRGATPVPTQDLHAKVESFYVRNLSEVEGIESYPEYLRNALRRAEISELIVDHQVTNDEYNKVDKALSLKILEDLENFNTAKDENCSEIEIDGEKRVIVMIMGKPCVWDKDFELRELTTAEKAQLSLTTTTSNRNTIFGVMIELNDKFKGLPFYEEFFRSTGRKQFDTWKDIEDFFREYYLSVILSREPDFIKKVEEAIPNSYRERFRYSNFTDIYSLIREVERVAIEYVKEAIDIMYQVINDPRPKKLTEEKLFEKVRTLCDLLKRLEYMSTKHPNLLLDVCSYLFYKEMVERLPGETLEQVHGSLDRLVKGTFCDPDAMSRELFWDLRRAFENTRYPKDQWTVNAKDDQIPKLSLEHRLGPNSTKRADFIKQSSMSEAEILEIRRKYLRKEYSQEEMAKLHEDGLFKTRGILNKFNPDLVKLRRELREKNQKHQLSDSDDTGNDAKRVKSEDCSIN
ncbi:hypothetical protein TRVA0_098S00122 [Trichomonascus vanleenenianus]|uniref:uncharacterized protein n=1 Tax=Trichomonascus vanleenenianus TaxID=2268995 RepID=UPI003ECB1A74